MTGRYRWVILAAGTTAQTAFSAMTIGLAAIAPQLRAEYHLSLGEIGVVLGAAAFGMILTLLPWGLLADRIGERAVIATGLISGGAVLAAAGETTAFGPLVAALALAGALGASVNAASGRAVMGWFGEEQRGLALGIRQTAVPIGGALAAATLPWLVSAGGTKLAFVALGAGFVAGGAVAGVLVREPPLRRAREPVGGRAPLRDPLMWVLAGGSSLYLTAQIATMSFVVLFLHLHRGLSTHAAAAVLAVTNLLGIGARIGAGRWSDRMRARVAPLRLVGLALAVSMVVTAALVDAPLAVLVPALIVATVLGLSWNGLAFTAAAERAGAVRAGAALGFQQTTLGRRHRDRPARVRGVRGRVLVAARVRGRGSGPAGGSARPAPGAGGYALRPAQPGDYPKCRRSRRQLVELGIDAAELARAVRVARLDLGPAHRQRLLHRADGAEAVTARLGRPQHPEVDLDPEHLLHAADERVPVLLVRVDERTRPREARRRVDDLVAVHLAAAALELVLRMQWERRRLGPLGGVVHRHSLCVRDSRRRKS